MWKCQILTGILFRIWISPSTFWSPVHWTVVVTVNLGELSVEQWRKTIQAGKLWHYVHVHALVHELNACFLLRIRANFRIGTSRALGTHKKTWCHSSAMDTSFSQRRERRCSYLLLLFWWLKLSFRPLRKFRKNFMCNLSRIFISEKGLLGRAAGTNRPKD